MQRTVYVHCGSHKIGTSAIQTAFDACRPSLRARGVLYPASRDGNNAHHNLAWEIAGDRRFDPAALTIAGAVAQIAAFDGDAVLSSEISRVSCIGRRRWRRSCSRSARPGGRCRW